MNRRKALKNMSLVLGAASSVPALAGLSAEAVFAQGKSIHQHVLVKAAASPTALKVFNPHQNETVAVLSELIIPQTTTPGARAARVNEFIDIFLSSVSASRRQEFLEGLQWIDSRSQALFQKPLVQATQQQQTELLTRLSVPNSTETPTGQSFFRLIKSLTVFGYYTSKVGIEEELKFEGWIEYQGCTHPEHQA
ncbi:MAG: gluconate 2-dehydrogenase subunit 3 family protein [Acidobacteria bacterium]|nr:gluconate 2-dehydrogenase subunit 3 family protein [Acidobacteriota bacterium]